MVICITILFEKLKYYRTDCWFHSGDSPVEPVCKALFYLNYLMDFMMSCIKVPQPFGTMEPTNEPTNKVRGNGFAIRFFLFLNFNNSYLVALRFYAGKMF